MGDPTYSRRFGAAISALAARVAPSSGRVTVVWQHFGRWLNNQFRRILNVSFTQTLAAKGRNAWHGLRTVYAVMRLRADRFLETATPRQKSVIAAVGAGTAQLLFVAFLFLGLRIESFARPGDIQMTLGGPIGTRADLSRLPKFMSPKLPTVLPPVIQTQVTYEANVAEPQGSPNTTTPAEALAEDHMFPMLPIAFKAAGTKLVRLTLSITAEGTVADASVAQSSGIADLDELAISWVESHWRYRPAMQNGVAVAVTTTAIVVFSST